MDKTTQQPVTPQPAAKRPNETGSISTSIISANVNKDENKTNIKRNEGKTNTAMLQYEIDSDGWIDL
jgi:hypothetical protein